MNTIGHHTVENLGNHKELEKTGPVLSEYKPADSRFPFLGQGYYFWDYNYEMALHWGKLKYKGKCYIFEMELNINDDTFLDLVGSRKDMIFFRELMVKFEKFNNNEKWPISKFIEFIKDLNSKKKFEGIFPYETIRAIDSSIKIRPKYSFSKNRSAFTDLNPRMVICFINKNNLDLSSFKLKYQN